MKLENTMTGIVLSSNDVVATVLFIDEDEDGVRPIGIEEVDLPFSYRDARENDPKGRSVLSRGDRIKVFCEVKKDEVSRKKGKYSDQTIEGIINVFHDTEDEKADLFTRLNIEAVRFDKYWKDLCKRDLAKRKKEKEGKTT